MRNILIKSFNVVVFCLAFVISYTQTLTKVNLTKTEKIEGIIHKYKYEENGSFRSVTLNLYSNGKFRYSIEKITGDKFSEGTWSFKKDKLIIKSKIGKNDLPVSLTYSNDTLKRVNNFRINVLRNNKGEYMTDGFVFINNDSTECLPMSGNCTANYNTIDSIKVVFENGISSHWLKINDKSSKQISLTVNTDYLFFKYIPVDKEYKILRSPMRLVELK